MKRKDTFQIFFVILLVTEFYYIKIGGGIARISHFIAPLVVFSLARFIPRLFRSTVFLSLAAFLGVNLIAAVLSDAPTAAMASLLSLTANIGIAIATALIMVSGRVDITSIRQIILALTLVSIAWGLLQIVVFRGAGISLALSMEQVSQILAGFGPGFRTEANTFGKYMAVPFLLFLPELINHRRQFHLNVSFLLITVGLLMNFTRSSIYGLIITMFFVIGWYISRRELVIFTRKSWIVLLILGVTLLLFRNEILTTSEYALYKLDHLFSTEEILEGGSSGFRLMSMGYIVDAWLADIKTFLVGNGWGQVYFGYGRSTMQAGGGDLFNSLAYGGVFGGVTYLLVMFNAFFSAKNAATSSTEPFVRLFSTGVMFSLLGVFIIGQLAGSLIAPEFWMLIGISIFLDLKVKRCSSLKFN